MDLKPPPEERKKWDKGEWAEKARERDREAARHAQERDKAMREERHLWPLEGLMESPVADDLAATYGRRLGRLGASALTPGRKYRPDDAAMKGATKHAEAHGIDLEKNLGKTMLVSNAAGTSGPRGAGFYCELCNRTLKDSLSYLDHLNSRFHLSKLGQSTHVARSTVAQVRARIAQLREESKTRVDAKNYDFDARLAAVHAAERAKRDARREERRRRRREEREREDLGRIGVVSGARGDAEVDAAVQQQEDMAAMMGFAGFGGGRK